MPVTADAPRIKVDSTYKASEDTTASRKSRQKSATSRARLQRATIYFSQCAHRKQPGLLQYPGAIAIDNTCAAACAAAGTPVTTNDAATEDGLPTSNDTQTASAVSASTGGCTLTLALAVRVMCMTVLQQQLHVAHVLVPPLLERTVIVTDISAAGACFF